MHRDCKKGTRNKQVTTRCIAIVLKPKCNDSIRIEAEDTGECKKSPNSESDAQTECQTTPVDKPDLDIQLTSLNPNKHVQNEKVRFDSKMVFDEFKLRNRACYWNPELVDSIQRLEYNGFIEPFTILVKGDDIHLGNLCIAWGRRVLKDPANFLIDRIGDVNGIEMEVIPQTQFIPLPEILCLVTMDLNNGKIVATLDVIRDRLKSCYQGLSLPSSRLVYDTLGQLIREHKIFHTENGYFIVTPDTFRMHGHEVPGMAFYSPWTHLHPMYIPSVYSQSPRQSMRSVSCLVASAETSVTQNGSYCQQEQQQQRQQQHVTEYNDKLKADDPSQRTQRSMSLSVRRCREKGHREDLEGRGSVKRSCSVKGRNEINKSKEEGKCEPTAEKKGKTSLFAMIFGRNKKKPPTELKKPHVEYATFSAQFPPPEWMWYKQQLDVRLHTGTGVQQPLVKSGLWHFLQPVTPGSVDTSLKMGINSNSERPTLMKSDSDKDCSAAQMFKQKSRPSKHRSPVAVANMHGQGPQIIQTHTYKKSMDQTNIKLSSLPTRIGQSSEVLSSNCIIQPLLSSPTIHEQHKSEKNDFIQDIDADVKNAKACVTNTRSGAMQYPQKTKKNHQDRHTCYHQSSTHHRRYLCDNTSDRHDGVILGNMSTGFNNDISYLHHGQLPQKQHCVTSVSHSNDVNCIGLDHGQQHACQGHGHGQKNKRSHLHRQLDRTAIHKKGKDSNECDMTRCRMTQSSRRTHSTRNDSTSKHNIAKSHIYANVQISNEPKSSLPEKTNRDSPYWETLILPDFSTNLSAHSDDDIKLQFSDSNRHSSCDSEAATNRSKLNHFKKEPDCQNNPAEGTESSEHSMGTVINTHGAVNTYGVVNTYSTVNAHGAVNRHIETIIGKAKNLMLVDSGFSSPRVSENSSDSKKKESIIYLENNSFTCNNLKSGPILNNSTGQLNDCSDSSFNKISADKLYEHDHFSQKEVLNNMKYLQKDMNVSSQNLNVIPVIHQTTGTVPKDFDPKHSVAKKFNFDGDFHIVGVV